jgi:hypothetical protein
LRNGTRTKLYEEEKSKARNFIETNGSGAGKINIINNTMRLHN